VQMLIEISDGNLTSYCMPSWKNIYVHNEESFLLSDSLLYALC